MMKSIKTKILSDNGFELKNYVKDGMKIMIGGFGMCGMPELLVNFLAQTNVKNLTIISNNCGLPDKGIGILLNNGMVSEIFSSYVGENENVSKLAFSGKLKANLIPQGTLAEKIRCGGSGIPAFYTPTGLNTSTAEHKEIREFNGRDYLLESSLQADIALIKAHSADIYGNLVYHGTAQNFNPLMAKASKVVFAEVEQIVEELDPNYIHTPFIYVDYALKVNYEKFIEKKHHLN